MKPVLSLAGLFVLAVASPQPATALTLARQPAQQIGEEAVRLSVAIHLLDLLRIDDANQTAFVDFALWVSWQDESLASPGAPARFFRTNQIWVPNLQVMNSLTLTNRRVDVVEVDENGNAHYRRRLVGTISIPRDLSDFPVDQHELRLTVVAGGMTRDVGLVIDERLTGQSDTFSIQEWDVGPGNAEISEFVAAGESFPMLVYEWEVRRKFGYYIWKVIVPLAMVVMMSWVVFWLDPKQAGPQIGIAATALVPDALGYLHHGRIAARLRGVGGGSGHGQHSRGPPDSNQADRCHFALAISRRFRSRDGSVVLVVTATECGGRWRRK
jgi:hypothetical protein